MAEAQEVPKQEMDRGTLLSQARELRSGAGFLKIQLQQLSAAGIAVDQEWIKEVDHVFHIDPAIARGSDLSLLQKRLAGIRRGLSGFLIERSQTVAPDVKSGKKRSAMIAMISSVSKRPALRSSGSAALQRLFEYEGWRELALSALQEIDQPGAVTALHKEEHAHVAAEEMTLRAKLEEALKRKGPRMGPGILTH